MTLLIAAVAFVALTFAPYLAHTETWREGYRTGLHGLGIPQGMPYAKWREFTNGYRAGFEANLKNHGFPT